MSTTTPVRRRVRPSSALVALVAAALWAGYSIATSPSTSANSPGRNGQIAVGSDGDIWSGRPDGSQVRQLTSGPAYDRFPAYSASGELVAFSRHLTDEAPDEIWVMRSDGSGERQVTTLGGSAFYPSLSSRRPRVAFESDGDIYSVRLNGRGLRRLTVAAGTDSSPVFSPGGNKIAWSRGTVSGAYELLLMRADGTHKRRIARSASSIRSVDWSPDGQRIVYGTSRDLRLLRVDGTPLRGLKYVGGTDVVWAPDGRWILSVRSTRSDDHVRATSPDGTRTLPITRFWSVPGGEGLLAGVAWQPKPL